MPKYIRTSDEISAGTLGRMLKEGISEVVLTVYKLELFPNINKRRHQPTSVHKDAASQPTARSEGPHARSGRQDKYGWHGLNYDPGDWLEETR
ncbi:unnamed protein product [Protopolystoma xenopodis]|uniref:Uncharacterized protein n=1 Tax=Protopolystoma xenopodis TaxID=117903 RepID=A0A448WSC3_9PLAT|nr:unnamed protein product [Protopolystoma xenopodis]